MNTQTNKQIKIWLQAIYFKTKSSKLTKQYQTSYTYAQLFYKQNLQDSFEIKKLIFFYKYKTAVLYYVSLPSGIDMTQACWRSTCAHTLCFCARNFTLALCFANKCHLSVWLLRCINQPE